MSKYYINIKELVFLHIHYDCLVIGCYSLICLFIPMIIILLTNKTQVCK